jgi:hypothetical protein
MADKKEKGGREGDRPDRAGPSVFPRNPGERPGAGDRDPEEEGSAGKTQQ